MAVRAVIFRLFGALLIVAVVFFASFFIAIAIHPTAVRAAGTASADDLKIYATSLDAPPLRSAAASSVPTTAPNVPVITDPEDVPVAIAFDPNREPLDLDPVFDSIQSELAATVGVPVRLPAELHSDAADWQPTISTIDASGYVIHIGVGTDCNGATACRISTFTARRSVGDSPQLGSGTRVPLPNGLSGVLSDSTCGQDCNNSFITWIEDGVRYSVGSKVTSGRAVLDLAWRAIDRSLPTPTGPDVCGPGAPKHEGRVARTITSDIGDERTMHWIAVCSEAGTDVEIIDSPGELRWVDLHSSGYHAVVHHDDDTSTLFAIDDNRPRPVIDATTGGRLSVGDLTCVQSPNGAPLVLDRSTGEELRFLSATAVRRVDGNDLSEAQTGGC